MRASALGADLRQPRRDAQALVRSSDRVRRAQSRRCERGIMILQLALKSLRNRRLTAALTVLSIALAMVLLLGVERIRSEARESFASTISGTDLIVGARSSPVHLLLYSVFRIGNPTNNVRWESFETIAARPEVAWAIPISLGDSHRGFRVLGTTPAYFEHFRYGRGRKLELASGKPFV